MGGREGSGGGGGGGEADDDGGCGGVEGGEYGGDDAGDGGGRGIGMDTVGKERDEGPHKSRKSTDSGEECASKKKGRDSSKVTSRETRMRRAIGSQQRYPLRSVS